MKTQHRITMINSLIWKKERIRPGADKTKVL